MSNTTQLFEHMQRYTREVFAERLRKDGFSSYKGQDIHWYRLVNGEVIQAIHFAAFRAAPCTFAEIIYECHPLFIPPVFRKSPIMNEISDMVQTCKYIPETIPNSQQYGVDRLLLYTLYNNRPYRVPDSLIMCSPEQNYGLDVLEKLLSFLNKITTPRACYEWHKDLCQRFNPPEISVLSSSLVDEALYWQDEELYAPCIELVMNRAEACERCIQNGVPIPKMYRQDWERIAILKRVFETGKFEEHRLTLEDRAQYTLRLLERNTGTRKTGDGAK